MRLSKNCLNFQKFNSESSKKIDIIFVKHILLCKMVLLDLSNENLTKIPIIGDDVTELYLCNNQITKIENLPNSLQILNLQYNQITKIENLPSSIQALYLSNNQITKIENLPSSIQTLYLSDNQITKIENLPNSLQSLCLGGNQIAELPLLLLELIHLNNHVFSNNQIKFLHPLVDRWLLRNRNRNLNNINKVYSDKQNIHNSNIQKSFRNSLENLLKDKDILTLNICKEKILECDELEEQVKRELLNYCDDKTEHSVYLVKFDEVFKYVVSRIAGHSESTEMFKILNEEIKDTICKCFTGRMTRLVNVLNGFYDDITIQIGSNEQISNIIIMLKERHEGDGLVKQIRLEMEERNYDKETIEEWLTFVE